MIEIIKRPIVTEKNSIYNSMNTYIFEVDMKARKTQIKVAVETAFRVKVEEVRTVNCRNRARRAGTKMSPVAYWKKAFVKLAPGEKISLFEGA